METAGRGSNEREGHGVDNVVKFPRDWIGPPEALVPFGPAADREEAAREATFGPEAFWTEDAASLHQAIEVPAVSPVVGPTGAPRADVVVEPDESGVALVIDTDALAASSRFPRITPRWPVISRPRPRVVMVALGLLLCLVAVVFIATRASRLGPTRLAASVVRSQDTGNGLRSGPAVLRAQQARRLMSYRSRLPSHSGRRVRAHARAPHAGSRPRHPAGAAHPAPSVTEASYSTSPPSTSAGGATSATTGTSAVSLAPSVSGGSSAGSAESSSSGAGGSSSGPTGAGAPFGPGQMGPAKR